MKTEQIQVGKTYCSKNKFYYVDKIINGEIMFKWGVPGQKDGKRFGGSHSHAELKEFAERMEREYIGR